ncbi:MAG: MATE family efflux transporter [Candidatus Eremiobacterota bacterium]
MSSQNITGLPYSTAIKKLAIPAILTYTCQIVFEFIDAFWLGLLRNSEVFAAVGAASFITWALYALMNIVSGGVNSFVAQYAGAKDRKGYRRIAMEGLILSVIAGIIITVIMNYLYHPIFLRMGLTDSILEATEEYFYFMNIYFVISFLFITTGTIFNAHGDTKTTFWTNGITILFNIVLAPLLILGYGFIPGMGVGGAALSTIIAQAFGIVIRVILLVKKDFLPSVFSLKDFTLRESLEIMKVGIPVATGNFIFCMVFPFLTKFITMTGNIPALCALNICHRVEGVAYFICTGFAVSAATMAGQYTGIKDMKKAIESAWANIYYVTCVLLPVSLIFIIYPHPFITLMTDDKTVLLEGVKYMRIIGFCEIFLGFEIVFQGVFTGLGNTLPSTLIYIPLTVGRIPLAYFLAFKCNMGVEGIWWAISISAFLKGTFVIFLFSTGWWKKREYLFTEN